jgi:maleate isomerase
MVDTLGWRKVFGVVTPSTNTVVQPEYDDMRPNGVTNHIARMFVPNDPVRSDADFNELLRRVDVALEDSIVSVMTCQPDHLILGISAESIWGGGVESAKEIGRRIKRLAGDIGVTQAADALPAALKAMGVKSRIGLLTPYFPVAEKPMRKFFDDIGYEIVRSKHMSCEGPVLIGRVPETELRDNLRLLDGSDIEAIVQFGANLPMGSVAADAERWLGKPVLAINTVTYWHALRTNGISDRRYGFGRLLAEH